MRIRMIAGKLKREDVIARRIRGFTSDSYLNPNSPHVRDAAIGPDGRELLWWITYGWTNSIPGSVRA